MKASLLGPSLLLLLLCISCMNYQEVVPKPQISVTNESISDWGGYLKGYAHGIKPERYQISIYVKKEGLWYIFPDAATTSVRILENNFWQGQNDGIATDKITNISIFLFPTNFTAPQLAGEKSLPMKLHLLASATYRCELNNKK